MRLIVDIGNTRIKTAVFNKEELLEIKYFNKSVEQDLETISNKYIIKSCIISSVSYNNQQITNWLCEQNINFLIANNNLKLPIVNLYKTKETLGYDRIAAAVGAFHLFPKQNILIIDSGSALTIDFVNKNGEYLGGNISPGIEMRFKALNQFTGKLPLLQKSEQLTLTGNTTGQAIINGVQNGIIFEIEKYIELYSKQYNDIKIVITGGDCIFFEKKIKNTIFANSNLVLIGLNRILAENEE